MRGLSLALVALGLAQAHLPAADWPQILGPHRNGHTDGESLQPWSAAPKIRWRYACGAGYAGVAVASERVLLWHRQAGDEVLACLSVTDGSELWKQTFPAIYSGGVDPDTGPRCVPLIAGDTVVVYGAAGDLHAVDLRSGEVRWTRPLGTELQADEGYFGVGSTPLVIDDQVIVEVGGRTNAGLAAVGISDGQLRWKSISSEASYASPVAIQISGETRVIAPMRLKTFVVDPSDGSVLDEFDFGRRGPSVVAATPLVSESRVFLTASYGVGCRMIDLVQQSSKNLWQNEQAVASQYATPLRMGEQLFAITGREDFNNAGLVCLRWGDGKELWSRPDYGTAHLIGVGPYVLSQHVDGRIDLLRNDPKSLQVAATSPLPEGTYRSLPALADGVLYCRRTQSPKSGELLAIELRP